MAGSLPDLGDLDSLYDPHEDSIMSQAAPFDMDISGEESDGEQNQGEIEMEIDDDRTSPTLTEVVKPYRRCYTRRLDQPANSAEPFPSHAHAPLAADQGIATLATFRNNRGKLASWPYPYADPNVQRRGHKGTSNGANRDQRGSFRDYHLTQVRPNSIDSAPTGPCSLPTDPNPQVNKTRLDAIDEGHELALEAVTAERGQVIRSNSRGMSHSLLNNSEEIRSVNVDPIDPPLMDEPHDHTTPKSTRSTSEIPNNPEHAFPADDISSVRYGKQPERPNTTDVLMEPAENAHLTKTTGSDPDESPCSDRPNAANSPCSDRSHPNRGRMLGSSAREGRHAGPPEDKENKRYELNHRRLPSLDNASSTQGQVIRKPSRSPSSVRRRSCSPRRGRSEIVAHFGKGEHVEQDRCASRSHQDASPPARTSNLHANHQGYRSHTGRQFNRPYTSSVDSNEYATGGRKSSHIQPLHQTSSHHRSQGPPLFCSNLEESHVSRPAHQGVAQSSRSSAAFLSSGHHSPVAGPSSRTRQHPAEGRSSPRRPPALSGTSSAPRHAHVTRPSTSQQHLPFAGPSRPRHHSPVAGPSRHAHVTRPSTSQQHPPVAGPSRPRHHSPVAGPSRPRHQSTVSGTSRTRDPLPIAGPSRPQPHSSVSAASNPPAVPRDAQPQPADDDSDDSDLASTEGEDSSEVDLAEQRKYKNRQTARNSKKTDVRHHDSRMEKYARTKPTPSQHDALATSIHDYIKLLLGIRRKGRGVNASPDDHSFPDPPSELECVAWEQRKIDQRVQIESNVNAAVSRYLESHPNAKRSLLIAVETDAAEEAITQLQPIVFSSQIPSVNPNLKYSILELRTCEGALALAGFSQCAFDWASTLKSTWNEAVSTIILQEWEKCYLRGGADKYLIDTRKVTYEGTQLILERWYENKRRQYVTQANDASAVMEDENSAEPVEQQEQIKRKKRNKMKMHQDSSARKRSRKRVSDFRCQAMQTYFPKEKRLYNIITDVKVHSEDEVDASGTRYRVALPWRSNDLSAFLAELDKLYHKTQVTERECSTGHKVLDRGDHHDMESAKKQSCYPPKGFPVTLIDHNYWAALSKAEKAALKVSSKDYQIQRLLEEAVDWQTPEK